MVKDFKASARNEKYGGELSFRENLEALKYLPPFLRMIWQTDSRLALGNIILRILLAGVPVSTLYIGKLIIDEVVLQMGTPDPSTHYLWTLVGLELGLALISAGMNRGISLLDALLGDKFSNETSVRIIEHAARLDLPQFEDSTFYDKMERARRQTTGRSSPLVSTHGAGSAVDLHCVSCSGVNRLQPLVDPATRAGRDTGLHQRDPLQPAQLLPSAGGLLAARARLPSVHRCERYYGQRGQDIWVRWISP